MNGLSKSTAGTLLTTLDNNAVTPASTTELSRCSRPIALVTSGVMTVFSSPPMMMNKPTNMTKSGQSISRYIFSGLTRRVSSRKAPPRIATMATGWPRKKSATTTAMTNTVFKSSGRS